MKNFSVSTKIKLRYLFILVSIWIFIGFVMTLYDHFSYRSEYVQGTTVLYSFTNNLMFNMGAGFMGSLMGGIFLLFYVNEKFRERPYGQIILSVAVSFVVVVTIITVLFGVILSMKRTGEPFWGPAAFAEFKKFVADPIHIKNILWWAPIVVLTQFIIQVNDKFGHGILWNFIRGKYHTPKEEDRIFMFVDLMSSTTIAEKLGNQKYHSLLKDFFADITNSILYNKGEIYQYVGDEVVISWKIENGIENNNCLKCFFDMRQSIQSHKEKYMAKYGLVPDFKAGAHYGKVIAGEVGIIKKDITYSGDVLNTGARIQSKCNEYNVKVITSDELLELMPDKSLYKKIPLGEIELRGKEQKVKLSTIELNM